MHSPRRPLATLVVLLGALGVGLGACSESSPNTPASGGTTKQGGGVATGGSKSGGGATATGGTNATGGVQSTGGVTATGGVQQTGGVTNTGGSQRTGGTTRTGGVSTGGDAATGGTTPTGTGGIATGGQPPATGGIATGGIATGGMPNMGGASATGGRITSTGGQATGGQVTATGGSTPTGGSTGKTSAGCGVASPLKTGNFTESIGGATRKWMLDVPSNYDGTKPYKLIFVWHPLGGNGSQIVSGGFNGLKSLSSGSAIFATADGLSGSNGEASGTGWWNANGGDMKLFQAMFDKITAGLCVDLDRVFSTGFSFGGMMSYTLPFEFDVFRAVAPCSGKTGVIPFTEKFTNPVPIMAFHGDADTFVQTALGKAFFDKYLTRNKCGTQTTAVSPTGCNQYQGCTASSTWCIFKGAHTTWSEEPAAIWKFFSQF